MGSLVSQIEETLGGLRIIKAFNAESKMKTRFDSSNNIFRNMSNKIARRQQMAHPMSEFLGTIAVVCVLWFGGTLILDGSGSMDASKFIYYLTIFYLIINPPKTYPNRFTPYKKGWLRLSVSTRY